MNLNGWLRLSDDKVVAGWVVKDPRGECEAIRVIVIAASRKEAVSIARSAGLHNVRLQQSDNEPTREEVETLRNSSEVILWRPWLQGSTWRHVEELERH